MGRSMKLLSIINRYYLISLLLFFILAGFLLFYAFSFYLNEEQDEQLNTERVHFLNEMRSVDLLNMSSLDLFDGVIVKEVSPELSLKPEIFDSLMYDAAEKIMVPYRLIRFSAPTKKMNYLVVIKMTKLETGDIVNSIFMSLMLVFGLLCIILFISNLYLNKKVWFPFLETISAIKTLNINDQEASFKYKHSRIDEFNELNLSLQKMIEHIKSDYLRMKEFSENASHELQTPLTIIRSKLESLLQSKDLKDEDAQLIDQALECTVRLSRLNLSLLLLTKIENHQYEQKQLISFSQVFDKYIELYAEIIEGKELSISFNKDEECTIEFNPVLSDILISNLLGNAIKHNVQNGDIVICVKQDGFRISNTGEKPECSPELMFSRFKKGNHSPEHLGLGLALVKEIVDISGFEISYIYENNRHVMLVKKNEVNLKS